MSWLQIRWFVLMIVVMVPAMAVAAVLGITIWP